jgi:hypothetical protein
LQAQTPPASTASPSAAGASALLSQPWATIIASVITSILGSFLTARWKAKQEVRKVTLDDLEHRIPGIKKLGTFIDENDLRREIDRCRDYQVFLTAKSLEEGSILADILGRQISSPEFRPFFSVLCDILEDARFVRQIKITAPLFAALMDDPRLGLQLSDPSQEPVVQLADKTVQQELVEALLENPSLAKQLSDLSQDPSVQLADKTVQQRAKEIKKIRDTLRELLKMNRRREE